MCWCHNKYTDLADKSSPSPVCAQREEKRREEKRREEKRREV